MTAILGSITLCGCISFEKTQIGNYNIKNNSCINSNVSKNQTIQNVSDKIVNNNTNILNTLNYEIIAYGAFGEKNRGYYYYYKDNKTIIVINLEEMPTAGYKIKIINITETANKITVYYKVIPPKEFAAMVVTYPYIKLSVNGTYNVECKEVR